MAKRANLGAAAQLFSQKVGAPAQASAKQLYSNLRQKTLASAGTRGGQVSFAEGAISGAGAEGAFTGGKSTAGAMGNSFKELISKHPNIASIAGMIFAQYLASSGANLYHDVRSTGLQAKGMQAQTDLINPQNVYNQMALPGAQEHERMLRSAAIGHLAGGGVLGPSLAQGEYSIGG